jgi:2-polyprenyl-3-methyl-5-hydroxy-6-metoxy-1,4-benzoquinol methylase
MIELEVVCNCMVCDSSAARIVATGRDYMYETSEINYSFNECQHCGHLYLSPRPSLASATLIYPSSYSSYVGSMSSRENGLISRIKNFVVKKRFKNATLGLNLSGKSLLEIGAGDGEFSISIRKNFPQIKVSAIDFQFSDDTLNSLRTYGVNCLIGPAEGVLSECKDKFDIIVMNQLIEHLWDVDFVLKKIFDSLNHGGILLIETPDPEGYDRALFSSGAWGNYYFPRHLNLFSSKNLSKCLKKVGFSEVKNISLMAPLCWAFTCNSLLSMGRWVPKSLTSQTSIIPLLVFTPFDIIAKILKFRTSNQKFIAKKPIY